MTSSCLRSTSRPKNDGFDLRLTGSDPQKGGGLERVESSPARGAGIEVENVIPPLAFLPMAVPEDDHFALKQSSRISQLVDNVDG